MTLNRIFSALLSGLVVTCLCLTVTVVSAQTTGGGGGAAGGSTGGGSNTVPLLAPLGEEDEIEVSEGAGTLIAYFNSASNWMLSVAVGFCVIWVVIGGIKIMISGGDSGKREEGRSHIFWAITGLVMLLFAGFILRSLNSMFFI